MIKQILTILFLCLAITQSAKNASTTTFLRKLADETSPVSISDIKTKLDNENLDIQTEEEIFIVILKEFISKNYEGSETIALDDESLINDIREYELKFMKKMYTTIAKEVGAEPQWIEQIETGKVLFSN